jgi:hypothetical protein
MFSRFDAEPWTKGRGGHLLTHILKIPTGLFHTPVQFPVPCFFFGFPAVTPPFAAR